MSQYETFYNIIFLRKKEKLKSSNIVINSLELSHSLNYNLMPRIQSAIVLDQKIKTRKTIKDRNYYKINEQMLVFSGSDDNKCIINRQDFKYIYTPSPKRISHFNNNHHVSTVSYSNIYSLSKQVSSELKSRHRRQNSTLFKNFIVQEVNINNPIIHAGIFPKITPLKLSKNKPNFEKILSDRIEKKNCELGRSSCNSNSPFKKRKEQNDNEKILTNKLKLKDFNNKIIQLSSNLEKFQIKKLFKSFGS